ncbi:MAG TPA: glutamate-5-semialdehyde dehydrogenase, partial [Tepidisphaeraceae bacterium]|nr:glutamate-5-semialdehyde dehydrogenase [Tepidisphaeraceae bacterium]
RSRVIARIGELLRESKSELIAQNKIDLINAEESGLAPALIKRLMLDDSRIDAMARSMDDIAHQPDPVGAIIESKTRADGLKIDRVRVPIGSVLFVYESRPNVTVDAAAICLRSGNAVILRGGKEAFESNKALGAIVQRAVRESGLDPNSVQIVETIDRALLPMLLKLDTLIDVAIPRGGHSLIRVVVDEATMPVLKHFDGNCHIYIDRNALDENKIIDVIANAKTSYPGGAVCNAVEHLLFHRDVANKLIVPVCDALRNSGVEIRGDEATRRMYPDALLMSDEDWSTEYLAFIVGIKVVDSIDDAINHINQFGSHHTDAILSTDERAIDSFVKRVDSASIMINASTRLADGGEYGLGAEIGISTDKLHARGPMGAADMCTYKWIVRGNGHLRH